MKTRRAHAQSLECPHSTVEVKESYEYMSNPLRSLRVMGNLQDLESAFCNRGSVASARCARKINSRQTGNRRTGMSQWRGFGRCVGRKVVRLQLASSIDTLDFIQKYACFCPAVVLMQAATGPYHCPCSSHPWTSRWFLSLEIQITNCSNFKFHTGKYCVLRSNCSPFLGFLAHFILISAKIVEVNFTHTWRHQPDLTCQNVIQTNR